MSSGEHRATGAASLLKQVDSLGSMLASDDASRVRGIALLAQVRQLHSVSPHAPELSQTSVPVPACRAELDRGKEGTLCMTTA